MRPVVVLRCLLCAAALVCCLAPGPAQAQDWQRPAVLAGRWYPAQAAVLEKSIANYLAAGQGQKTLPNLRVLVVPHAGHMYSGRVAGAGWAQAMAQEPKAEVVILLGPAHRYPLRQASIWPQGAYDSPLGPAAVDQKTAAQLTKEVGAQFVRLAHMNEHCLEVQLPFLRLVLPDAKIVPVLTGRPNLDQAHRLGQALAKLAEDKKVLIVVSTDLSHFHDQATARRMDGMLAARVKSLDPEGLARDAADGKVEACGMQGLLAAMFAARQMGAGQGVILAMDDSGETSGDRSKVVGYLAAAYATPAKGASGGQGLDQAKKAKLHELAKQSLYAAVLGKAPPSPPTDDAVLMQPRGAFVTLRRQGRLRGCIGRILARRPLAQCVIDMARAAALEDPRFRPVTPGELDDISIEISVLTPPAPISPGEVQVGRDGLIIQASGRMGLLLPQVPLEQGWDREQYLDGLCRKAGLPPGAWGRPGTRLYAFQAEVF